MKTFRLFLSPNDEHHNDSPCPWIVESESIDKVFASALEVAKDEQHKKYLAYWLTKVKAVIECPYRHFPY